MPDHVAELQALVGRARRQRDPLDRARTLAEAQRVTGPALLEVVAEARATEPPRSWQSIADALDMPLSTLHRHVAAGAITVPHHDTDTEAQSA
ncbi:hypothetical protein ACWGLK_31575 [Streptomyces albidoflavus]|uniref:hypothetical protein n=1 Tax=unclassified Streptomyces TaxID=2593676 RepID=UPI0035DD179C